MPWIALDDRTVLNCASRCSEEARTAVSFAKMMEKLTVRVTYGKKVMNEVLIRFCREGDPEAWVKVRRNAEHNYLVTEVHGWIPGFSRPPDRRVSRVC